MTQKTTFTPSSPLPNFRRSLTSALLSTLPRDFAVSKVVFWWVTDLQAPISRYLPKHVVGNHAKSDEEAQRCADEEKGQVHGDGSRPASMVRLITHV